MESASDGSPPHPQYGSVDDSRQQTPHSSLLPRSSRPSNATNRYPATLGEQQRPLTHNKDNLRGREEGGGVSRRLAVAVACGLAFLAGSGVSWTRTSGSGVTAAANGGFVEVGPHTDTPATQVRSREPSSSDVVREDDHDVPPLAFTAVNDYTLRDGKPGQDYPWLKDIKIVEPHRHTTFTVVAPREGFEYRWEVRPGGNGGFGKNGEIQAVATGAVTIMALTELEENVIVLEEVDGNGKLTNRLAETVMVKYVRREIRTLFEEERGYLLDAVSVLTCEGLRFTSSALEAIPKIH